jgi:alpha-galactosidase
MTLLNFLSFGQLKRSPVFALRCGVVLLFFSGISLLSFASGELREGQEFERNGCYARLSGSQLVLGNAHIQRTWHIERGNLFATSFIDLDQKREWINVPSGRPSPEPPIATKGESLVLRGGSGIFGPTEAESLRVELEQSSADAVIDYEFQVFPETTGIRMWLKVKVGKTVPAVARPDESKSNEPPILDAIEHLQIKNPNLRLIQVILRDQTDRHNELAFENEWLLHPSEALLQLQGNIFVLEDTISGDGLVFLKEAPQPESRPIKAPFDAWVSGSAMGGPVKSGERPTAHFDVSFYGHGLLESGQGYSSALIAYHGGRLGRIAALQNYQRQIRQFVPERDGKLLSNTWGDRSLGTRLNEDFIRKEIDSGKRLGVEIVEVDEGWQTGQATGKNTPGGVWENYRNANPAFWTPNSARFPKGFSALSDYAHARGLKLGLWFAPDPYEGFSNWRTDADQLLGWNRDEGVDAFKLDLLDIQSKEGETNYHALLDRVLEESSGKILLDLDVTANARQGYFGNIPAGPIFVENRYTDWHSYWPHQTLRNFWKLSQYVDPVRIRMEFLNPARNTERYDNDPLAPVRYEPGCLFAIAMFSSPLAWFENTGLSPEFVSDVSPLIRTWKNERDSIYSGTTLPIGDAPDGVAWTGFASVAENRHSGYLLVFRELNQQSTWTAPLSLFAPGNYRIRVLGGDGNVRETRDGYRVQILKPLGFVWVKLDSIP